MDTQDLRKKSELELERLLASKRQDIWNFRFGTSGGKARNVKEEQALRRSVARILTILGEMKRAHKGYSPRAKGTRMESAEGGFSPRQGRGVLPPLMPSLARERESKLSLSTHSLGNKK